MATASPAPRTSFLRPLIGVVLIVAILILAKTVIVPLVLAVMLTFVLAPVVNAIQRCGFGRLAAVIATVILTGLLCGLVGWVLASQARHLAQELPTHRKEIDEKIAGLRTNREGTFPRLQKMVREVVNGETEADTVRPKDVSKEAVVVARPTEPSNFEQLVNAAGPILEPLAQTGLVVVLVIFMLIQREDLRNRLIGLPGHGRLMGTTRVLVESAHRVSRFLLTQTLINVGFGIVFASGLLLIGVPYALLWGGLAVVLRFVPVHWEHHRRRVSVDSRLRRFARMDTARACARARVGAGTRDSQHCRAAADRTRHGSLADRAARRSGVLDVGLGSDRAGACHAADGLPGGPRPELSSATVLRTAAWGTLRRWNHTSRTTNACSRMTRTRPRQIADKQAQERGLDQVCDDVLLPALALARLDRKNTGLSVEDEAFVFLSTKDILVNLPGPVLPSSESLPPRWTLIAGLIRPRRRRLGLPLTACSSWAVRLITRPKRFRS